MSAVSKSSARNNSLRGKVAVIGIGMSPVGKVPGKSPLWLAADATKKALADAGIQKREIDGVLSSHAMASPFHRFSIAFSEYFGIQPTFSNTLQVSGATAATMFTRPVPRTGDAGTKTFAAIVAGTSMMAGSQNNQWKPSELTIGPAMTRPTPDPAAMIASGTPSR